jgi:L-alanine-DL-glutamate epimerase-like enolase superfamily enzyme
MRIRSIRTHLLTAQWRHDPWFPQALHSTAIVRVETDTGLDGLGEITLGYFAAETVPPLVNYFTPVLVGQDAMDTTRLARAMFDDAVFWARSGAGRSVIGGIEMALWDLKGKALGVPVWQLLGGRRRERIPVYASGGPSCWPLEDNVRKVSHYASLGYRAVKLSTRFYEWDRAEAAGGQRRLTEAPLPFASEIHYLVKNFDQIRREVGSAVDLAIDGHQGGVPNPIPVSEAVEIADALAPFRLRFYEEPLAYTDVDGYRELRARSRIPIAGGESLSGLDSFHTLIAGGGLHVIQPDLGFVGGLHETVRIIHHAEAYNVSTAIHTGASQGPSLAASWHLAAAMPSVDWLEHVVNAAEIQNDLLVDEFAVRDGCVGLPAAPGLGVQLTADVLEKYRFAPGSGERT